MADLEILDLEEGSGDSESTSSRCLVGKVMVEKSIKALILANILSAAWKTRAPFHVDDWNSNVFLFRFESTEDRLNILCEGPWSVMNSLLVLIPLTDGMVISEINFNNCPFWVQIHGLPVGKMSKSNAEIIGRRLGSLLALETSPNEEVGDSSGYGPELRTGRARKGPIPIEIIRAEVDEAEIRVQNLISRRPVIYINGEGARVATDAGERVPPHTHTTDQQIPGVVGEHNSLSRTDACVLPRPGGTELKVTGALSSIPLSIPQGESSLVSTRLTPVMDSESGMPFPPISPPINPYPDPYDNPPLYFVIEPPDSPKSPKSLITHPQSHCLLTARNPSPSPSVINQPPRLLNPFNIIAHLSPIPAHTSPKAHSPSTSPKIYPHSPNKNPTTTVKTPPLAHPTITKPSSPTYTDIPLSTVFKSLSLKRKPEEGIQCPTQSKILRICSPIPSPSPLTSKPTRPTHKSKKRTPSPIIPIPPKSLHLIEDGLCDVPVHQVSSSEGKQYFSFMVESNQMAVAMISPDSMKSGDSGLVAGPQQPHSPC
ncbi:hypothetical protein Vadar_028014 [Vaccinium darrowii]|uniref:Uncharacterized protein n=1 Tax=Vaccinium darrowii TaxID=229202 RepID=A0ACB7YH17_9ERIC|nr:hypothetical protein Vadar_028014 [Vaccinium darrowii]